MSKEKLFALYKGEEFIEKQLKLSKRQNKDERYDYLCSEFNADTVFC